MKKTTLARLLALLLVAIMAVSVLAACGGGTTDTQTKNPVLLYYDSDVLNTNVFINIDKLEDILEIVELTTENWDEYIKVYSYSVENVETNAFGDVISTETTTYNQLGAGNELLC